MEDKKNLLFDYEKFQARQLASQVIDKPVPSVWMIFVPIFFVFYIWKIKQYSHAINDFVGHYLISRHRALETAFEALQNGRPPKIDLLVDSAGDIPATAKPFYRNWMSLLVNHYSGLLVASGESHQELKRTCYQNKKSYLQFYNALNETEKAFQAALFPINEGDQQDIRSTLMRLEESITTLRCQEAEEIFGSTD